MDHLNPYYDLAVVGAGPAGCHLAAKAARAGCKVILFDPKAPWEKPCGGGITHKAWSKFPILSSPRLRRNEVFTSIQITSNGRFFIVDQGHPLFIVSRKDLAKLMLDEANEAGVIHHRLQVSKIETWGPNVRLTAGRETFFAGFVAGADGVRSLVRSTFIGDLPKQRVLYAISQLYEGKPEDSMIIRITPFPGYVWSFPRLDCLGVGAGSIESGRNLKAEIEKFMNDFYPGRKQIGPIQGALLPYMAGRETYCEKRTGDGWALIGDAAGFCDTLTGEGILYAVWSADLLADAFLKGRVSEYEKAWRKAFGSHLATGTWAASHLFSPRNLDRFFAAITVCPTFRKPIMNYVWNLPSYPQLATQLLASLPGAWRQWRRFKKQGGKIDPLTLGAFKHLAPKLNLNWE